MSENNTDPFYTPLFNLNTETTRHIRFGQPFVNCNNLSYQTKIFDANDLNRLSGNNTLNIDRRTTCLDERDVYYNGILSHVVDGLVQSLGYMNFVHNIIRSYRNTDTWFIVTKHKHYLPGDEIPSDDSFDYEEIKRDLFNYSSIESSISYDTRVIEKIMSEAVPNIYYYYCEGENYIEQKFIKSIEECPSLFTEEEYNHIIFNHNIPTDNENCNYRYKIYKMIFNYRISDGY